MSRKYFCFNNVFFVCIIGIIFFICNANLAYSKESDSNCNILLGKSYEVSSEASEIYPDTGGEITDGNYALPYLTDQGWQGRENITSYTVTVDLGKITNIVGFKADFFRYENAGVILPDSVSLSVSKDGNNYIDICSGIKSTVFDEISSVAYVGNAKEKNVSGRYVRLTVSGKQWSFIDEWEVYSFKKKKNVESRFYGTFVQPELCEKWTESEWEREFALMKGVGMEHLILQWTADSKNMTTVYPSDISGFEQNTTSDLVAKVLNMGEKYDIDVYLGLQLNEDWFGKYTGDQAWINEQGDVAVSLASDLWMKYKNSSSFAGWYLSFEVDNWNFKDESQWKILTDFYNKVTDSINGFEEQKPIMISPFYNTVGGLNSKQWEDMWGYILTHSKIDILALQDGVGAGHVKNEKLAEWFKATYNAIKKSKSKTSLWADVETFDLDRQPMPTKEMIADINAVLPYVDNVTCFSFNHYLSPQQVPEVYYETYKEYVDSGSLDSSLPSTPQNIFAENRGSLVIELNWTSSSDNVGVAGYNIYRDGVLVKKTYTENDEFMDVQLEPQTSYKYIITARDAAGNESKKSEAVVASTSSKTNYDTLLSIGKPYTYGVANPNYDPKGSKLELYKDPMLKKLTDGNFGSGRYDDGTWVGIENGKILSVTMDLQKLEYIHEVEMEFKQDISAYIFLPSSVKVEISQDGNTFVEIGDTWQAVIGKISGNKTLRIITDKEVSARYIRFTIHPGSFAWTFLDELSVR